jgi:hypothetical protein
LTTAGDLVFRVLVVAAGSGLLAGACLLTARLAERQRDGLAVDGGERRLRRRRSALRGALGISASSGALAAPAFVWPDVAVGLTATLIAAALIAPIPWLSSLAGGPRWAALGGWVSCAAVLAAVFWLLAGSLVASDATPGRLEQDATLATIRELGEAFEAWREDRGVAGSREDRGVAGSREDRGVAEPAGEPASPGEGPVTTVVAVGDLPELTPDEISRVLVPRYLPVLPRVDGWGRPLELRGALGERPRLVIRSAGEDGRYSADEYLPGLLPAGSLDGDLVWADGIFVRQPAD